MLVETGKALSGRGYHGLSLLARLAFRPSSLAVPISTQTTSDIAGCGWVGGEHLGERADGNVTDTGSGQDPGKAKKGTALDR